MKALVVYYSRTGTTKKVADAIANALKCPVEALSDPKNRRGPIGYARCAKDIILRRRVDLGKLKKDVSKYDLVIIGTPVWLHQPSSITRTFMQDYCKKLKKVAFFCTYMGAGEKHVLKSMAAVCGKEPVATLSVRSLEVYNGTYVHKVNGFVDELKHIFKPKLK
ncbi:MAG: NAD(P)H-dependent oxidoreductase [Candidatus Micrarchaeota archaeon]|nr:NAD(P)H-dependent oxidoreductase [Candidatus Micrarchaeota archaeon]